MASKKVWNSMISQLLSYRTFTFKTWFSDFIGQFTYKWMVNMVACTEKALNPFGKCVFLCWRESLTIDLRFVIWPATLISTSQSHFRSFHGKRGLFEIGIGLISKAHKCFSKLLLICGLGNGFQCSYHDVDVHWLGVSIGPYLNLAINSNIPYCVQQISIVEPQFVALMERYTE
jgi:hypothetical protein